STTRARTRTLRITFKDDTLVDASTITPGDIVLTGPNNFSRAAKLISLTPSEDSSTITATYRLTTLKAGKYTIKLAPKSLRDIVGRFNKPRTLGSFTVKRS